MKLQFNTTNIVVTVLILITSNRSLCQEMNEPLEPNSEESLNSGELKMNMPVDQLEGRATKTKVSVEVKLGTLSDRTTADMVDMGDFSLSDLMTAVRQACSNSMTCGTTDIIFGVYDTKAKTSPDVETTYWVKTNHKCNLKVSGSGDSKIKGAFLKLVKLNLDYKVAKQYNGIKYIEGGWNGGRGESRKNYLPETIDAQIFRNGKSFGTLKIDITDCRRPAPPPIYCRVLYYADRLLAITSLSASELAAVGILSTITGELSAYGGC